MPISFCFIEVNLYLIYNLNAYNYADFKFLGGIMDMKLRRAIVSILLTAAMLMGCLVIPSFSAAAATDTAGKAGRQYLKMRLPRATLLLTIFRPMYRTGIFSRRLPGVLPIFPNI